MHHPKLDFERWAKLFPLETLENRDGSRRLVNIPPGDPARLWKPGWTTVTSPADLCATELIRRRVAQRCDLGPRVPVDLFLWSTAPPKGPYLTKLGGTPHRESTKPWPRTADGKPFTFIAQFCFLDSRDIVSKKLPGDVMLVFFANSDGCFSAHRDVHIEWSDVRLQRPLAPSDCPPPSFRVPNLSGVIHRTDEFPEGDECFEKEDPDRSWLLATTQSTTIGRETHFIQNDPREYTDGAELLCTLSSLEPHAKWPFVDLESLPAEEGDSDAPYGWGRYEMMFGDVGCMYFLIDEFGEVYWECDCY